MIPKALTIAGSDSGGGAGIQADLKTFSALGCYGTSVITALTAQNTQTVKRVYPIPAHIVSLQVEAVLEDIGADAVKIGLLRSVEIAEAVIEQLKRFEVKQLVVDTVMVASSGRLLLQEAALNIIAEKLFPLARVITPNLPEASVLLGRKITTFEQMKDAVKELGQYGSETVLLKGGHKHDSDMSNDILYRPETDEMILLKEKRVPTQHNHGTGCTLSSAIAAHLAKGETLEDAVQKAKAYITEALYAGMDMQVGKGIGPVHHFFGWW